MPRPLVSKMGACLALLVLLVGLAACAAQKAPAAPQPIPPGRDQNLEKTIVVQLNGLSPAAVPLYQQATTALDAGNYTQAKQLYQQVLQMAPTFDTAYRRLGSIEISLKNTEQGIALLQKAVDMEPNGYNKSSLAMALLARSTPKDNQDAYNLATQAVALLPEDEQANLVLLISASATNNLDAARWADATLLRVMPASPTAHFFSGLLAATDHQWEKAEAELYTAQNLGMDPAAVQKALVVTGISSYACLVRTLKWGGGLWLAWLLGFGLLFLAGVLLSRATLQALGRSNLTPGLQIQAGERRIRSLYRLVIGILSVYFYISIPFVIIALLLVVGGAFYLFFAIGSIPIYFALLLVVMLFISLAAIFRALFTRLKFNPPGYALSRSEAPELWALVEGVAQKLEVRPVDAIYLTPWVDIAVIERGSILQKMRGKGQRLLILGMAVLPEMTQGQLSAILAHEYGHFSNRDTAGGDLAIPVQNSLHQLGLRLVQSGATQIYNPVWLFVMGYQRVFLRVTRGAARLQEVLADRYAVAAYGVSNFVEGLKSIIRQSFKFKLLADHELAVANELHRAVLNLYDLPMEDNLQPELDEKLGQEMAHTTSPYDSHPAPRERIAWIESLPPDYACSASHNPRLVLDLIPNPLVLQQKMTEMLLKNVRK